jgi:hypothetical protein
MNASEGFGCGEEFVPITRIKNAPTFLTNFIRNFVVSPFAKKK